MDTTISKTCEAYQLLPCLACSLVPQKFTPEEAAERAARLSKMRHLLFYAEQKAKRLSKIKSKEYHRWGCAHVDSHQHLQLLHLATINNCVARKTVRLKGGFCNHVRASHCALSFMLVLCFRRQNKAARRAAHRAGEAGGDEEEAARLAAEEAEFERAKVRRPTGVCDA